MATRVMYGRREGQVKDNDATAYNNQDQRIGFAAQGIDPKSVLVIQPKDWKRIQDNLSRYNKEAEEAKIRRDERERLHETSKSMVKNWDNTNEGIRQKKLHARKLKEEKEEEERVKLDIEEAKLQAEKRKEAIERAKTLQYYQTDRVKEFHGALLLTEVMKERDAQIELKKSKQNWEKDRDAYLHQLHQREIEESIKRDQDKAAERYNQKRTIAQFQLMQVTDHIQEQEKVKVEDIKEGENIKQQVEMYEAAKVAIVKQKRADKVALKGTYKKDLELKKIHLEQEKEKEYLEDVEIGKFVDAKKKMIQMRKKKEVELFQAFQNHTENMRKKLHEQMKQKVDDEDDRIAKAVAEQEKKRLEEEQRKDAQREQELQSIRDHRVNMIEYAENVKEQERTKDEELLKIRVLEDQEYEKQMEEKRLNNRVKSQKNQKTLKDQMNHKKEKKQVARKQQLKYDKKILELVVKEEEQFQDYAQKVIGEAKSKGRNPYPLVKAAASGPGGGTGPKFDGIGGLRPSYPTCDATGVQLPYYRKDGLTHDKAYGHVGKSGKRLGFNW
ncbi:cilia- and flagella- associated protein 210-like [Rhopilema esculentum]|uniref:cilia- and flagella- associated protein 210-like n=1 Tax=Rhopilema esculentum TaxID=499914 RepID=UPI0031E42733|eukprot:gene13961-4921_t